MSYFIYILKCADDSFYVGYTSSLDDRINAHNEGKGALYTAKRRPVKLVYSEQLKDQKSAIRRERQLKGWSKAKKQALINGNVEKLKLLSKKKHF
jgi:predicted GIY-YIG superfamily endonuclease